MRAPVLTRAHFSLAALVLFAATLGPLSCFRQPANSRPRRIALLSANILIPDASSQWMSLAVPFVLAQDLSPAPDVITSLVLSDSGVYQSASSLALQATLEPNGNQFAIEAALRDVSTSRNTRVFVERRAAANLIESLDALAKQIDGRAVPFSTHNQRALECFAQALSASDATLKRRDLTDAISADPSFGLAYISLLQLLAASGGSELETVLQSAEAHRSSFTKLDQARLDLLRSRLDLPGGRAPLAQQAAAAAKLVEVTPNDTEALSAAGASFFLEGRAAEGEATLGRAIEINPADGSLRQQLALGLLETRQYARAANVFEQLRSDNTALFGKAVALLLAGDTAQASAAFDNFVAALGNTDLATLLRARWQALSGHRKRAIEQLTGAHFNDSRFTALAQGETVIWELMDKQPEAARAAALGGGPTAELLAAGASSASEWRNKIDSLPANLGSPGVRNAFLRYGYFLLGFYPEAVDAWRAAEQQSGGTSLEARAMLAASLRAAGRADEAARIPLQPFVPDLGQAFSTVSFAQLRKALGHAE